MAQPALRRVGPERDELLTFEEVLGIVDPQLAQTLPLVPKTHPRHPRDAISPINRPHRPHPVIARVHDLS
jgi:hypothetical protein